MNPCVWGPVTWSLGHGLAVKARDVLRAHPDRSKKVDEILTRWVSSLADAMPCWFCRVTHSRFLSRFSDTDLLSFVSSQTTAGRSIDDVDQSDESMRWMRVMWLLKEGVIGKLVVQQWLELVLGKSVAHEIDKKLYSEDSLLLHTDLASKASIDSGLTFIPPPTPDLSLRPLWQKELDTLTSRYPKVLSSESQATLRSLLRKRCLEWRIYLLRANSGFYRLESHHFSDVLSLFALGLTDHQLGSMEPGRCFGLLCLFETLSNAITILGLPFPPLSPTLEFFLDRDRFVRAIYEWYKTTSNNSESYSDYRKRLQTAKMNI